MTWVEEVGVDLRRGLASRCWSTGRGARYPHPLVGVGQNAERQAKRWQQGGRGGNKGKGEVTGSELGKNISE